MAFEINPKWYDKVFHCVNFRPALYVPLWRTPDNAFFDNKHGTIVTYSVNLERLLRNAPTA